MAFICIKMVDKSCIAHYLWHVMWRYWIVTVAQQEMTMTNVTHVQSDDDFWNRQIELTNATDYARFVAKPQKSEPLATMFQRQFATIKGMLHRV